MSFRPLLSHLDGFSCAMGKGGTQGAGFYELSQSQMHEVGCVSHSSLGYVEWDYDPHRGYS